MGEWRWRAAENWVLTGFLDVGRVVALPATSTDQVTARTLRGYGLSAAWQGPVGIKTKLTWARRIGENPNPTATGTDGDGSLKKNRFWMTLNLPL
jgi:hypothetical protein